MASTINFTKGATDIDVNGPGEGQTVQRHSRYAVAQAADGTVWSQKRSGSAHRTWQLDLEYVTSAQKVLLQSFFDTDAAGPTNTFTYTHTDGNSYTARFLQDDLQWRRQGPNVWAVSLTLDIEAAIS